MGIANGSIGKKQSEHFPEREVETSSTGQGMPSVLERSDTMIDEPRRTAPHNHVAVFHREAAYRVGTALAAPQEHRGKAERNRNNRGPGIVLVAILMETEFRARDIAVDEAGVRIVLVETRFGGGTLGKAEEGPGHRRPSDSSLWIQGVVPIPRSIGHPADSTAVGHCNRHRVSTGGDEVPERRRARNTLHFFDERLRFGFSKSAQQQRAFFERFAGWQFEERDHVFLCHIPLPFKEGWLRLNKKIPFLSGADGVVSNFQQKQGGNATFY